MLTETFSEINQTVIQASFAKTGIRYFTTKFDDICHWGETDDAQYDQEVQLDRRCIEIMEGESIESMEKCTEGFVENQLSLPSSTTNLEVRTPLG